MVKIMKNISDKKAVVTGGAMGIGYAIVQRLLNEGCFVAVWDNNRDAISSAEKELAAFSSKLNLLIMAGAGDCMKEWKGHGSITAMEDGHA